MLKPNSLRTLFLLCCCMRFNCKKWVLSLNDMTIKYISVLVAESRTCVCGGSCCFRRTLQFWEILQNVEGFVGTSFGCLFCLLLLRLNSQESELLLPIASSFNLAPQMDISLLVTNYGLDDGKQLRLLIGKVLERSGLSNDITLETFKTFYKADFVCVTTLLRTNKAVLLSATTHPKLRVVDACFMSMCVPFLFTPFELDGDLYVDGCLTMNTPIYFPPEHTLAFSLSADADKQSPTGKNIFTRLFYVAYYVKKMTKQSISWKPRKAYAVNPKFSCRERSDRPLCEWIHSEAVFKVRLCIWSATHISN